MIEESENGYILQEMTATMAFRLLLLQLLFLTTPVGRLPIVALPSQRLPTSDLFAKNYHDCYSSSL